jgi:Zn-finger nucleic acid-binding protein
MIKIIRNNFDNWIDIRIFDKLIDNARTEAQAIALAQEIQLKQREEGNLLAISNRLKKSKKKFA